MSDHRIAIVRRIGATFGDALLTHRKRRPIDLARARRQHEGYVDALTGLGVEVHVLPPEDRHPDAPFVEDLAVALGDHVIITRPAHARRRAEIPSLVAALPDRAQRHAIVAPGSLEGGDVLQMGSTLYVGTSTRTTAAGREQLAEITRPLGYRVVPVPLKDCLHLKTAVTAPSPGLIVANREWVDVAPFQERGLEVVAVHPREPWAGNVLPVHDTVLCSASHPRTAQILSSRNLRTHLLDISEIEKAEAGLTCLALLRPAHAEPRRR